MDVFVKRKERSANFLSVDEGMSAMMNGIKFVWKNTQTIASFLPSSL